MNDAAEEDEEDGEAPHLPCRGHGAIAEIVHDVDVKDAKYGREEAPGVGQVVAGVAAAHPDDEARLERGADLFNDLYVFHSSATKR